VLTIMTPPLSIQALRSSYVFIHVHGFSRPLHGPSRDTASSPGRDHAVMPHIFSMAPTCRALSAALACDALPALEYAPATSSHRYQRSKGNLGSFPRPRQTRRVASVSEPDDRLSSRYAAAGEQRQTKPVACRSGHAGRDMCQAAVNGSLRWPDMIYCTVLCRCVQGPQLISGASHDRCFLLLLLLLQLLQLLSATCLDT
jgi:hypothetical protein